MQNVGQTDTKKLDSKVSVPSTSKTTTAKYNPNGNGKNNMSSTAVVTSTNNKFASTSSSPIKSDTETYSEFQPRVTDSSESDEESVSEVCNKTKKKF